MANHFPRWTNFLPLKIAICLGALGTTVLLAVPYFFTPKYTRVGYEPSQPVPFSHKWHAGSPENGGLGLDCRYCHSFVDQSSHSNVPTNETCINCHGPTKGGVKIDSPKLEPVRRAAETGEPINWVRVHAAPDYVYFNHAVHVNRGVSCVECHGQVNEMEVVKHAEPHSMGWCLDCHRNPSEALRPVDEVYNLDWRPEDEDRTEFYSGLLSEGAKPDVILGAILGKDEAKALPEGTEDPLDYLLGKAEDEFGEEMAQSEIGSALAKHWEVSPPESCASCHR